MINSICVGILLALFNVFPVNDMQENTGQEFRNILVVPYNRFEFHTEYSLDEIAAENGVPRQEVYDIYRGKMLSSIANYSCAGYRFKIVNSSNLDYMLRRINYNIEKKPQVHYAANLNMIPPADLKKILQAYEADYILFINWYHIKKDVMLGIGKGNAAQQFADHYIDYDIYDADKNLLGWGHKFELKPDESTESALHKGLSVVHMVKAYQAFGEQVCKQLSPDEGGK